jgi:hypothetical protein
MRGLDIAWRRTARWASHHPRVADKRIRGPSRTTATNGAMNSSTDLLGGRRTVPHLDVSDDHHRRDLLLLVGEEVVDVDLVERIEVGKTHGATQPPAPDR